MEIKKMWKSLVALLAILATAVFAVTVSTPSKIPGCTCDDDAYTPSDESMNRCQLASDFFIALAYFSIPLELVYFVSCSHMFPFRWIIVQFCAFIVLCGLTHFVSIWTFGPHSYSLVITQTILKALTAVVSCATAITLVQLIPELLHVKVRELFLKHKAAKLDREMDIIKTQEEVGRHVRMLTHVIRSTLDRHKILNTTLAELAKTLSLESCTVWMPNAEGTALELTHELDRRLVQVPISIPAGDPSVQSVVQKRSAIIIPSTCALGRASNHNGLAGAMSAVRLPLLHVSNFKGGTPEVVHASYAILVLLLSSESGRQWREHELQMIEVVADQVR
jgi:ethylene receptor